MMRSILLDWSVMHTRSMLHKLQKTILLFPLPFQRCSAFIVAPAKEEEWEFHPDKLLPLSCPSIFCKSPCRLPDAAQMPRTLNLSHCHILHILPFLIPFVSHPISGCEGKGQSYEMREKEVRVTIFRLTAGT